ncbi:MAG: type II toxin-antitoxin system HicB family antitoxin [Jiangellaceae bacterium]
MSQIVSFTALYEPVEDGWCQGRLVEIPGVVTAAPTREEAEVLLVDALREYLLSFAEEPTRAEGDAVPGRAAVDIEIHARSA